MKNKKIFTIKLEDRQQDFLELDIMESGIIQGYSIMFAKNRVSLLGIGTLDGKEYWTFEELKNLLPKVKSKSNWYVYLKDAKSAEPLPWEAKTLKYKIEIIICIK